MKCLFFCVFEIRHGHQRALERLPRTILIILARDRARRRLLVLLVWRTLIPEKIQWACAPDLNLLPEQLQSP